ncbi:hypothetical protein INR49_016259 [Caranx melampygus]|nr:hypothetical protein INR49_016259 [Caranx melampygus]
MLYSTWHDSRIQSKGALLGGQEENIVKVGGAQHLGVFHLNPLNHRLRCCYLTELDRSHGRDHLFHMRGFHRRVCRGVMCWTETLEGGAFRFRLEAHFVFGVSESLGKLCRVRT